MSNRFPLYLLSVTLLAMAMGSCDNETKEVIELSGDFSNCTVSSFALIKDDSVLAHLDSVFFSIDLVNGEIYNADSLPPGTKVDKLLVNIGTSSASGCDLTFRICDTDRDTTISFISSPKDSINFADGPVRLKITSYDGLSSYEYNVRVNVHKQKPDTLYWADAEKKNLPTNISDPTVEKTVVFDGKIYCLTGRDNTYTISYTDSPEEWVSTSPSLPAGADIESFAATSDALYILDQYGDLYTSADGVNWNATGEYMNHIYGGHGDQLLGVRHQSDGWIHVSYPSGQMSTVPDGCPVSGTSQLVSYGTKWSSSLMTLMIGGRDIEGKLTGAAWGYDGKEWARISNVDLDPIENLSLFPYTTPRVNTLNWSVTERQALIAMGGRFEGEEGEEVSNLVYISYDQGITWATASTYLQFAPEEPGFYGAQAIVWTKEMSVSRSNDVGWSSVTTRKLPFWATPVDRGGSRATAAVDSWECPYIYLFGGYDADNQLRNAMWRGVILRFTYRPLY